MDDEKLDLILEKLNKLEDIVDDNNDILKNKRNSERWGKFFWLIKWVVMIAIGIIGWTYIQPIYNSVMSAFGQVQDTTEQAGEMIDGLKESLDNIPSF